MEKANFGQIVSFLFGIANDCLVDNMMWATTERLFCL